MKTVLFFRPLFYMGGTEMAILNLVKKLKGFKIYIGYSDETSDNNLLNRFSEFADVVNMNNIDKFNVDILVNCSAHYHLDQNIKKILYETKILWIHHLINMDKSVLTIEQECKSLDFIISVSETVTRKLKNLFPNLSEKMYTIYNVVDSDEIKALSSYPIELPLSKSLNLVTVARVCNSKGFDRMLYLAKCLIEKKVDFKWFIIGNNYYKDEYQKIHEKYEEYKKYFEWLGFLDNPHNIVKKCDYSVLLSDEETWGLVLTESMILNVPCISTDFDVAYEQIKDGINGIILSREDLLSYKNKIDEIINNKDKYKKALSNYFYDNSLIIDKWTKLFQDTFISV